MVQVIDSGVIPTDIMVTLEMRQALDRYLGVLLPIQDLPPFRDMGHTIPMYV